MQNHHLGQATQIFSPLAIVVDSMRGGGAEKAALRLAKGFIDRGHEVDLLLISPVGEHRDEIFSRLSIYYLKSKPRSSDFLNYLRSREIEAKKIAVNPLNEPFAKRSLRSRFPSCNVSRSRIRKALAISRYLWSRKPQVMLSLLHSSNMAAINGRYLARALSLPLMVSIRNNVEYEIQTNLLEVRDAYPSADSIVCVTKGVAESAIRTCNLSRDKISVIHNPIPFAEITQMSQGEVFHPWFVDSEIPVILSIGRIAPQKDHHTLISAFSLVCREREARLVIMSNSTEHEAAPLLSQAAQLGLSQKFDILKFNQNPFRYMRRSSCFALSSKYEGIANVLPEAMACGSPIVSTDAPYGPSEILENGKWGKLVPVGNPKKLANAILETLNGDRVKETQLMKRARFFRPEQAIDKYLSALHELLGKDENDILPLSKTS